MEKKYGRPLKFKNKTWDMTSFYIPDTFKPAWAKLKLLSLKEKLSNRAFIDYCMSIEGIDVIKSKQGVNALYVRWLITEHVFKNHHKL